MCLPMSLPLATALAATALPKLSRRIIGLTQIDGRFEYSFRKLHIFSMGASRKKKMMKQQLTVKIDRQKRQCRGN